MEQRLIVTGASRSYGEALLALLGSLRLNWPAHPPVIVYDIGLDEGTRSALERERVNVKRVPAFCPHWRRHFTWKVWAWNDAPARDVLWIDAGIVVLRPLDEIFETIAQQGYFLVPTGMPLEVEAPEEACQGCGVPADFRLGKFTMSGGFAGFRKEGATGAVLLEALQLALTEKYIAATHPGHRHDQALMSLLAHRDLKPLHPADPRIYLMEDSPRQRPDQPIWLHRRALSSADAAHLGAHIARAGEAFVPRPPAAWRKWLPWYLVRRWLGRLFPAVIYDGVRD